MADNDRLGIVLLVVDACLIVFFLTVRLTVATGVVWALGCVAGFALGVWYGLGRHSA